VSALGLSQELGELLTRQIGRWHGSPFRGK
jgi:hypothetical protein